MNPQGTSRKKYIDKYIGPTHPKEQGLISFVRERLLQNDVKNSTICFINSTKGIHNLLYWSSPENIQKQKNTIVMQLLQNVGQEDDLNSWYIGMYKNKEPLLQPGFNFPVQIESITDQNGFEVLVQKNDFIRFKINIMLDGTINPKDKITDIIKVSADHFLGYETTKKLLQSILFPIQKELFENKMWTLKTSDIIINQKDIYTPLQIYN